MKRASWARQASFPPEQWDAARDAAREAILEAARTCSMITYTDVAAAITAAPGAIPAAPHSPVLAHLLGEILEQAWRETGLALTALVVHKYGDMQPGTGFYRMAREAGAVFHDPFTFWVNQVAAIFERYGRKRDAG